MADDKLVDLAGLAQFKGQLDITMVHKSEMPDMEDYAKVSDVPRIEFIAKDQVQDFKDGKIPREDGVLYLGEKA